MGLHYLYQLDSLGCTVVLYSHPLFFPIIFAELGLHFITLAGYYLKIYRQRGLSLKAHSCRKAQLTNHSRSLISILQFNFFTTVLTSKQCSKFRSVLNQTVGLDFTSNEQIEDYQGLVFQNILGDVVPGWVCCLLICLLFWYEHNCIMVVLVILYIMVALMIL